MKLHEGRYSDVHKKSKEIFELVQKDEKLQQSLNGLVGKAYEQAGEELLERIVELGAEMDLEFSKEDIKDFKQEVLEKDEQEIGLSDEELDKVAGGFLTPEYEGLVCADVPLIPHSWLWKDA